MKNEPMNLTKGGSPSNLIMTKGSTLDLDNETNQNQIRIENFNQTASKAFYRNLGATSTTEESFNNRRLEY